MDFSNNATSITQYLNKKYTFCSDLYGLYVQFYQFGKKL